MDGASATEVDRHPFPGDTLVCTANCLYPLEEPTEGTHEHGGLHNCGALESNKLKLSNLKTGWVLQQKHPVFLVKKKHHAGMYFAYKVRVQSVSSHPI